MYEHSSPHLRRAMANLAHAAQTVAEHHDQVDEPLWRRLFKVPREPHLIDRTRQLVVALDDVLWAAGLELTSEDVAIVGKEVNRVVDRLEVRISALSDPKEALAFVTAVYALRARFEEIAMRVSSMVGVNAARHPV